MHEICPKESKQVWFTPKIGAKTPEIRHNSRDVVNFGIKNRRKCTERKSKIFAPKWKWRQKSVLQKNVKKLDVSGIPMNFTPKNRQKREITNLPNAPWFRSRRSEPRHVPGQICWPAEFGPAEPSGRAKARPDDRLTSEFSAEGAQIMPSECDGMRSLPRRRQICTECRASVACVSREAAKRKRSESRPRVQICLRCQSDELGTGPSQFFGPVES